MLRCPTICLSEAHNPKHTMPITITREFIDSLKTERGGWTRATLETLGIPWSRIQLPKWWADLLGREIPTELAKRALAAKNERIRRVRVRKPRKPRVKL